MANIFGGQNKGVPAWQRFQPGQTSFAGLGGNAARRNPNIGAAMQQQWNSQAGNPSGQFDLFSQNPALFGNHRFTTPNGINAPWINSGAYSNMNSQGIRSGPTAPLTPGVANNSYNGYTSSFGNPQGGGGSSDAGGGIPAQPGWQGGPNQNNSGATASWDPSWRPDQVAGRTGDEQGTYGGNSWQSMGPGSMNGRYSDSPSQNTGPLPPGGEQSYGWEQGMGESYTGNTPGQVWQPGQTNSNVIADNFQGTGFLPGTGSGGGYKAMGTQRPRPAYFTNPNDFRKS